MNQNICITSTSLQYCEGSSDKEYHVAIEPEGEGYLVTFAYGRRGNTLTTGTKTNHIVSLAQAHVIHDKLVRQKMAKGYRQVGDHSQPGQAIGHAKDAGEDTGIRCQLLNPIEEHQVVPLLFDRRYCLHEWSGATWTGAQRRAPKGISPEGCDRRGASKVRWPPTHDPQTRQRNHRHQPSGPRRHRPHRDP